LFKSILRYGRRRRVAARLLYDDVLGLVAAIEVDRQLLGYDDGPRAPLSTDALDVDLSLWEEHRATLAEVRDPNKYEIVRDAYGDAESLGEYEPRAVAEWKVAEEREQDAELRRVLGEDDDESVVTDEPLSDDEGLRIMYREEMIPEALATAPRSEAPESAPLVARPQSRPALLLVVRSRRELGAGRRTPISREGEAPALLWERLDARRPTLVVVLQHRPKRS